VTLDEFTDFVRVCWDELPPDLRETLEQRGIAIAVSEARPAGASACCYRHGDIVLFYGWLGNRSTDMIRTAVLHEVAHACGFSHRDMPKEALGWATRD
jgi:predicted Zn-dependent protease with MMP-like domain